VAGLAGPHLDVVKGLGGATQVEHIPHPLGGALAG
jgi:hypothetical protein